MYPVFLQVLEITSCAHCNVLISSHLEYAQVIKMLGNGRLSAFCFDGQTRLCHIRGKLRKKVSFEYGSNLLIYV